jgi:D-aminoacyl-tRNA deacylase
VRVVLQRVSRAVVRIDGEEVGEIGTGLLLLVGFTDGEKDEETWRGWPTRSWGSGSSTTRRGR